MYDYIIVGAGTAGCVLAHRLVETPTVRVLLLEAGGPNENLDIHNPHDILALWQVEEDWVYYTVPQRFCHNRRLHWPRGKVLGGSSSFGDMIYIRGHRADYDAWAYQGNAGWDYDRVLPYFCKSEDFDGDASEWHGVGGPLHVLSQYEPHPLSAAIVAAGQEIGYPYTEDFNGEQMAGVGFLHLNIKDGKRHSAARAFLIPVLRRPNLTALPYARARQLLFEGSRCVGVEYAHAGEIKQIRANIEVIVSAGTLESPKLLLLSGIGRADELRQLGLKVTVDLSGVGQNLHDHTLVPLIYCAANAQLYEDENVIVITGVGVPRECFYSANIAPTNQGPRLSNLGMIQYAYETYGARKITCMAPNVPGMAEWLCAGLADWGADKGVTVETVFFDPATMDPTSLVLQAISSEPDAITVSTSAGVAIPTFKAAEEQDLREAYHWMGPTSLYDLDFPAAVGSYWDGYLDAQIELVNTNSTGPDNQAWLKILDEYGSPDDPRDSFSQAGFLAAKIFVATVLELDPATIDRDTVTEAIRNVSNFQTDLMCGSWYFGPDLDLH